VHEHLPDQEQEGVLIRGTHPGTLLREAFRANLSWALSPWENKLKWILLPNIKGGKDYDPYRVGEIRLLHNTHRYPHEVEVSEFVPCIRRALPHLSPIGAEAVLKALEELNKGGTLAEFHARATEAVFRQLGVKFELPVWVPPKPPSELNDPYGEFSTPWVIFCLARMGFKAHAAGVAMTNYLKDPRWGAGYAASLSRYEQFFKEEVGIINVYPPPSVEFQARFKGLETQYTILSLERK
jgi:hypothetical protein